MNPPVELTVGPVDPNANPITINELFALWQTVAQAAITGSYVPYVIGNDTPGADKRDFAWIELDTQGRPIAIKTFYQGNWRRVYNGMIGEIRGYSGDPSIDFDMTGNNPGKGKIGLAYDGWYLCNGLNGTPNLSDRFLLGGHMDNSVGHHGYTAGWQSAVTNPGGGLSDLKSGGAFVQPLTEDNLPLLSNAAAGDAPGLWIYGKAAKDGADHFGNKFPLVDENYANQKNFQINLTEQALGGAYGRNPPVPTWTLPPFISVGWIIFRGYI